MIGDRETDALEAAFDMSARGLAERFGRLAVSRIVAGRDPREAARLAASYAREAWAKEHGKLLPYRPLPWREDQVS
jgi:hypothetical protein